MHRGLRQFFEARNEEVRLEGLAKAKDEAEAARKEAERKRVQARIAQLAAASKPALPLLRPDLVYTIQSRDKKRPS